MSSIDILIVGGGPVGLQTARRIKQARPQLRVAIVERYPEYKRSHPLRIDPASLAGDSALLNTLITLRGARPKIQASTQLLSIKISTNKLEECLLEQAKKEDVKIAYQTVNNLADLKRSYPDCKLIIAADGAHSTVRHALFGEDEKALSKENLQYMVELRYEAEGEVKPLDPLDTWRTRKLQNFLFHEHISRDGTGKSKISVRFFVDQATYEQLGAATLKNPRKLSNEIPEKLRADINRWLNVRQKNYKETYISSSGQVTKTILSAYSSHEFSGTNEGTSILLIGDAAFGVPYFRSLNNGLLCASALAALISDCDIDDALSLAGLIKKYGKYATTLYKKELRRAKWKNGLINFATTFSSLSAVVPWQVNLWSSEEQQAFNHAHKAFTENVVAEEKTHASTAGGEEELVFYDDFIFMNPRALLSKPSPRHSQLTLKRKTLPSSWYLLKYLIFAGLVMGSIVGTYFCMLLLPLLIHTLAMAASSYWIFFFACLMLSFAIIASTISLFAPALVFIKSTVLIDNGLNRLMQILSVITLLAGLSFGIYLCALYAPLILSALISAGLSHGTAIFVALIASVFIIDITINLFMQLGLIRAFFKNIFDSLKALNKLPIYYMAPISLLFISGQISGAVLGIYLSVYFAPLIINLLATLAISHSIAIFTVIALACTLIAATTWLMGRAGLLLGSLAGAIFSLGTTPAPKLEYAPQLAQELAVPSVSATISHLALPEIQQMQDFTLNIPSTYKS